MSSTIISDHLRRIQESLSNTYTLNTLSKWVEKHLILEGKRYSFKNYEFQRDVLDDPSRVVNSVKPAQIGMTTTTIAYFLSVLATQRLNVIYALPSANDAAKLTTTKVNPILYGSPELYRLLNKNVDSNELKEINGNFLFTRGTKSETAALSISADLLVVDEVDRCDPDTVKQFRSRLQNSPHKLVRQFSTPTIDGVGISKEAESSRRFRHFCSCYHCDHKWLPSFHADIVVPEYDKPLPELDRLNLKDVRWRDAYWKCPSCGKDPKMGVSRLEWVCENPGDDYEAATYYITPVTAHKVLTPSYMVRSSTEFNTRSEFLNQVLGETSSEENDQITAQDLENAMTTSPLDSSDLHVLGADMGLMCAVTVARMTTDGAFLVVHREFVPLHNFETRRRELCAQYRVVTSVHDVAPYVDVITRVTDNDPNAFGCIFTTTRSNEMYTVQTKTADPEEGKLNLRLVKANRTAALDRLLALFKQRKVVVARGSDDHKFTSQMLSLKRAQVFVKDELAYQWVKSDGQDHMHFSLMYAMLACMLRGTAGAWTQPGVVPLISSFRLKPPAGYNY